MERCLVLAGLPYLMRKRRHGGTVILAYHNIVPDGGATSGDRSLHLSQRAFAMQLDVLRKTHDVLPLDEALDSKWMAGSRPRAVITFDDAYRGAVTAGVEELAARSLPATIFIAPAFVGGGTFWWDSLAAPNSDGVEPELRARALSSWCGRDRDVRAGAISLGMAEHTVPEHSHCASEADLRRAAGVDGITLGSHSWSHSNLTCLDGADLVDELTRPLVWLRDRFQRVSTVLSYPYGLASAATERAASAAGYAAAVLIDGGWLSDARSAHALPRINIPASVSVNGFILRISGVIAR